MIRADSTLADARYRSVFPQASRPVAQRSDPRTVKFEPGLAGTAARRGEDASGSVALYWLSGEP